jgi:hypothetical protein
VQADAILTFPANTGTFVIAMTLSVCLFGWWLRHRWWLCDDDDLRPDCVFNWLTYCTISKWYVSAYCIAVIMAISMWSIQCNDNSMGSDEQWLTTIAWYLWPYSMTIYYSYYVVMTTLWYWLVLMWYLLTQCDIVEMTDYVAWWWLLWWMIFNIRIFYTRYALSSEGRLTEMMTIMSDIVD